MYRHFYRAETYNRKSCSQHGSEPLTVTVVDLTFCSLSVTYVLNWPAWKSAAMREHRETRCRKIHSKIQIHSEDAHINDHIIMK